MQKSKPAWDEWLGTRFVAALVMMAGAARAEDSPSPVTIADLAGYREALNGKPEGEAIPATFASIWAKPEDYRGKRVRVEGRIARAFHQGPVGTFPPLSEMWVESAKGNPMCLVFADATNKAPPRIGDEVEFVGTFLRLIPYQGSTALLAPLIVGDRPPVRLAQVPKTQRSLSGLSTTDWLLGTAAGVVVIGVLLTRHLKRPVSRADVGKLLDRPPEFEDAQ